MPLRRKQITYSERPNRRARAAHARGEKEFKIYDTSAIRPKQSTAPLFIIALIIAACVLAAMFIFRGCAQAQLLPDGEQAVVTVESGEGAQAVAESLVDARLISSSSDFLDAVRAAGAESSLISGTYRFEGGIPVDEIVAILQAGPEATADIVTIIEGSTRQATAEAIEEGTNGRITVDDFLAATDDASAWVGEFSFLQSAGSNSLEGFLYPKTYAITVVDDANSVASMMLQQFELETSSLSFAYPEEAGLDFYQAVTLASIVEKEANSETAYEVASVFYNRLASDRPYLESDATTAYEFGGTPTPEQVHADTPYSTYSNEGLPPTPICSPSYEYLEAICDPSTTNYLFFYSVDNADGTTDYYFSQTYEEHQEAIANY